MSTNSNFIKINVGGTIISTLKGTLTKEPESMLARIINTKVPIDRDHEGNIFIDRCGEKFKLIIEFLRTGDLKLTNSSYTEEDIEKEPEVLRGKEWKPSDLLNLWNNNSIVQKVNIEDWSCDICSKYFPYVQNIIKDHLKFHHIDMQVCIK